MSLGADATTGPCLADPAIWYEALERHAVERAQQAAITRRALDGSYVETSFAGLHSKVSAFAQLFRSRTERGQLIPVCVARGEHSAAAMLAALITDRAFCCVNGKLRAPQVEHIVTTIGAPFALIDEAGLMALRGGLADESPLASVAWTFVGEGPPSRAAQRVSERLGRVEAFGAEPATTLVPESSTDARALGCCLFTSGSTGVPKGVLVARSDLAARARAEADWYGLSPRDRLLNLLPFSFDVGLNQLLSALVAGAELVVLESWFPRDIMHVVEQRAITGISAVPSMWADFVRDGRAFDRKGPHRALRYLTVSGGDLSEAQHAALPQVAGGADIFKTYGQTEAFRVTSLRPEEYPARPRSVGRAFPGVHLYVLREDGTRAAPRELGQVVHTGLGTMLGYLNHDGANPKLGPNPHQGASDPHPLAVFTGDVGYLDEAGYLFLAGRRDDMVKVHGNRVYPAEVASLITALPGVAAAEVVVLRGEAEVKLVAFVVLRGDFSAHEKELRLTLSQREPSYMLPDRIVVLEQLPRTPSGKPDRPLLAEQASQLFSELDVRGASPAAELSSGATG